MNTNNPTRSPETALARRILWLLISCFVIQETGNFYWLHHVFLNNGEEPSQVVFALGWFPLAPAFLSLFLARVSLDPLPDSWGFPFLLFNLVLALDACLGLINTSDPQHYAGDIGKFIVPWAALYLTLRAGRTLARLEGPQALNPFGAVLLLLAFFTAGETWYFGSTTGKHIFLHLYFLALAWSLVQTRFPAWVSLPLALICAKAAVFSNKRYCVVLMVFTIALSLAYLFLAGRVKRLAAFGLAFLLGGALATTALWASPGDVFSGRSNTLSKFSGIVDIVGGKSSDTSYQARRNEGANVVDYFDKNPEWWGTGLGFGCEIPAVYPTGNILAEGTIHHVHMAVYAFLLRNGVLGVLLLMLFIYKTLVIPGRFPWQLSGEAAACVIFCAGKAVGIFTNDFILGTTDVAIIGGLGFVLATAVPSTVGEEKAASVGTPVTRPERGAVWTS